MLLESCAIAALAALAIMMMAVNLNRLVRRVVEPDVCVPYDDSILVTRDGVVNGVTLSATIIAGSVTSIIVHIDVLPEDRHGQGCQDQH